MRNVSCAWSLTVVSPQINVEHVEEDSIYIDDAEIKKKLDEVCHNHKLLFFLLTGVGLP